METRAMRRLILTAALALSAACAHAQTPAQTLAKPAEPAPASAPVQITGKVTSSDMSSIMIQTADGKTLMAMFSPDLPVQQGSGAKVAAEDLKAGQSVTVTGPPPGADGMMDATRVVVGAAN
jgi:hypothetical protein